MVLFDSSGDTLRADSPCTTYAPSQNQGAEVVTLELAGRPARATPGRPGNGCPDYFPGPCRLSSVVGIEQLARRP